MSELQLDLTLLLPEMDAGDRCVHLLTDWLHGVRGVDQAQIVRTNGSADLYLQFDPNLVSLAQLDRLAHQAGGQITARYRHEQVSFSGLDSADAADVVERALARLPGLLHASVNYAAGMVYVAYDSEQLAWDKIEQTMRGLGVRVAETKAPPQTVESAASPTAPAETARAKHAGEAAHDHDHGSAPAFLPHWLQERWTLLLVALAGLFLIVGWVGEQFLGLPAPAALAFYLLAYLAGWL